MAVAVVLASGHVGGGSGKWWEPVWPERAALFKKKYELGKKKEKKNLPCWEGDAGGDSEAGGTWLPLSWLFVILLSFAFFRVLERIGGREMEREMEREMGWGTVERIRNLNSTVTRSHVAYLFTRHCTPVSKWKSSNFLLSQTIQTLIWQYLKK